jgi:hypothetical protein
VAGWLAEMRAEAGAARAANNDGMVRLERQRMIMREQMRLL